MSLYKSDATKSSVKIKNISNNSTNNTTDTDIINEDDDNESESFDNSEWVYMPENVLLKIFMYLDTKDVLNLGSCCRRYYEISQDNWIWRKCFQKDFGLPLNRRVGLKPGTKKNNLKSKQVFLFIDQKKN